MSDVEESSYARVSGEVIKWLRNARGVSQRALEQESGVPQSTISRVERGEALPDLLILKRLAIGLGVTLRELIDYIEFSWFSAGKAAQAARGNGELAWWVPVMSIAGAENLITGAVALALDSRLKQHRALQSSAKSISTRGGVANA